MTSTDSTTTDGGVAPSEIESRVVKKVARRLIPFLILLYFVNYLDRTNIAFAKLTMSADLGMTETMFGLASGLFFVGYLLFEVPSNLALHRFGARLWIARIMLTWGILAAALAFVPNVGSLYFLRILLGIAEAGFFPGVLLYLTFWFPKKYRVRLMGLFLLTLPLSSALGAPLGRHHPVRRRSVRPGRMARDVLDRGSARRDLGVCRLVLPHRSSRRRQVVDPRGAHVADEVHGGRGKGTRQRRSPVGRQDPA
ncbi:hypothetical protein GCM10020255_040090 [Rhodococcus baikonurensis]